MQHVACDLCGSEETEPRLKNGEWTIVRCRRCSLVYLDPRPEPAVIEKDFDWFRHAPLQTGARRRKESGLRRLLRRMRGKGILRRKRREDVVLGRVREFVPEGRFLDVGCGDGFMVAAMTEAGYEAHGLDISEGAVEYAHSLGRTTVRKGTIQNAPFPEGHFDAILLMSYLEHEHFPSAAMAKVQALLRPGGCVFVKVPHYGCWNRRVMGRGWSGYFFPQHLYYFTPRTMGALFEKSGLSVLRNGFWDHVPLSDVLWATARKSEGARGPD